MRIFVKNKDMKTLFKLLVIVLVLTSCVKYTGKKTLSLSGEYRIDKITYEEITADDYIDHLHEESDKLVNENYNLLTKLERIYGIASDPKSQEPGGPIYIDTGEEVEDCEVA